MFCEECGHDLDANGVCPICGYSAKKPATPAQPLGTPNVQQPNMNPGMQRPNMNPGMQQPNINPGMQRPNMNPGMQRPNTNPGMQQPNMNSGMQQPNMNPGMQRPNMNSGMQQPNMNPGMQQPNMNSGMQQPNMNPGMQRPNMNPGMQQPNMNPGMQRPNMNPGMQRPNMNPGMQQYSRTPNPYDNMRLAAPAPKKAKKKWPIFLAIGIAVIAIVVAIILIIRKDNDDDDSDKKTTESTRHTTEATTTEEPTTATPLPSGDSGTRTIMVYMVGSNLESDGYCATEDISEMVNAENDPNVKIVIYTGGANKWHTPEISNDGNTYLLVDDHNITCLDTEAAKNMGDASTLSNFINYGVDNYPAEQYSLILWNHGGGAFIGYGHDELTNDCLTLKELSDALAATPFHDGNKLEWIGFDACLMATIETADALSPYAKYLIASQEPEPSWGWDYSFLEEISSAADGAAIGKLVADHYIETTNHNFSVTPFSKCDITMSVMDLDKVDEVEDAINELFAQVTLNDATYSKYSRLRTKAKEIASEYRGEQSYDVIDLISYSKVLQTMHLTEGINLESALNDLVVYSNATEANANGVSIYHPYNAKQYSQYYVPMYYQFGFAEEYAKYIAAFANMLTGDVVTSDWDVASLVPYMTGTSLNFALKLNDSQADVYQKAYYVISRADTEQPGNYIFVAMNTQVDKDSSNTLTADFNGDVIYVRNDTTGELYEAMYTEQETTDTYTRYLLTAILYNDDIQGDDAMYAYFVLETTASNPQGTIIGCYPLMNYINTEGAEIFPDRYEIDISEYKNIAFGSVSHEFTSNEDLTNFNESDWSDATIWYNSMPISDGFSTTIGSIYDGLPYFGMFVIEDSQGNRHCSNLVQIQ